MSLKIYTYPDNPRVFKALIAAKYAGILIETPTFNFGVDNKTPEFLAKNPLGKVPVLETEEGTIFESNAIARYVARLGNAHLYGANDFEAGLVDQWLDFAVGEIDLPASVWLYPILGLIENNPQATNAAKGDIRKVLDVLNKHLADRTFFVGERISLADIVLVCSLVFLYTTVLEPGFRKPFGNLNRWFLTCINQPNFKSVLGEVPLCEKMKVAPAPKAGNEDKPKKQKQQQAQEKKPAKEKEKPKEKEKEKEQEQPLDDEDLEKAQQKDKPKNPLDSLPPTNFDLDTWKRFYFANEKDKGLAYFWENLDRAGFSLWFADYKYNEELDKLFMTCNRVGGFIQRLDPLRKYGFGSIAILGEEPTLSIKSVWLFRGSEIPAEMTSCDDNELYTWRRVNVEDPEDKQLFEDLLYWEGPSFEKLGQKFNQGKVFR